MKYLTGIMLATFLLFMTGCQNDEEEPQPPPTNNNNTGSDTRHIVQMSGNSFSPSNLTVNVGDTVVWMNSGTMVHTSTSGNDCTPDGTWNSGNINPGDSYSYIFNDEGSFDYYCIPHCELGMVGNVEVEE